MFRFTKNLIVAVACAGVIFPQSALAAEAKITDVSLGEGGTLHGRFLNRQSKALANATVVIQQHGQEIAKSITDEDGRFVANGLRGGQYHITSNGAGIVCRLWTAKSAPPSATNHLVLVSQDQVERAQNDSSSLLTSEYMLLGLIIAAAIAIPILVNAS